VLTYTLPENLSTATFGLYVLCEEANSERVLTFSKSIPVSGLEYSLELQPQTVKPGQNLTANVSNTGTIALSGDYELSIYDGYSLIEGSSGQLSAIAPGETGLLELEVPSDQASGTYTFVFELTDQLGATDSKRVSIYIPDASFEMTLDAAEYLQGDSIGVTANISNIENGSFIMSLFDGQDNTIATSPPEVHNASSGSVNLTFGIPEGIMSGHYVLFVEVKDQSSGLSNSTSQSLTIDGITIEPHIETSNTKYLEDDTINYEVHLNHSGTLPQGDAYIKAYLQEDMGSSGEFILETNFSPYPLRGDSDVIVNLNYNVLNIYDISSRDWTEIEVPVENWQDDVTLTADHIWIASDGELIGIDKNTGDISIFNESNSDYNESSVSLIEGHNGDIWAFGGGGVSVYSISDGLSTASINSPDISDPEDITVFEEIVAVIDSSGTIHEYNYMSDKVLTYETGLTDWNGLEFEYNQGIYWVLKTGGSELYRYNPATEETSGPEESLEGTWGLASAGETLYAVADWLYIFDEQTWNKYTGDMIVEDAWIDGIESADENVLVYGQSGHNEIYEFDEHDEFGGWITSLSGQGRQLVMDKTVQFADFSAEGTWQDTYISDRSGQLTFEVEAVTDLKQITDQAKTSVDVYERDVSVALSTAKEYYRPDEPINATVRVSNNAPATFESELVSSIDENEIGKQNLNIESGVSHKFEIPVSNLPAGNHTLNVSVGDDVVSRDIVVESPQIEVSMNVPEVVSSKPFTVELFANNPGNVSAKTGVTVTNLSIEEEFDLILAPGTSKYLALNTTVLSNTTVVAEFTGDINTRLTEDIEFGERAHIDTQCQAIYRPGTVEIPVNVTNTGQYKTDFNVSFSVNDTTHLHKSYILGINQSVDDVLVFDLAAGDYNLSADTTGQIPVEFEKVAFQVCQTTGFELGKPEVVSGNLSFMVNLSNKQSLLPFNGTVEIITDFYESAEQVNLSALENTSIGHNISLPELTPGNYTLQAQLLESQETIQVVNSTFTIQAPEFTVAPSLNKQNVQPGEILKYNFTVSNKGSIGAMADMYLDVPGIYEDTLTSWIASGDSHNFSFSFKAPDDLAEGYYPLYYGLAEDNLTESWFYLEGANVTVNSWLDKRAYLPGENATLTMQVKNNGNYPLDLYSRVKYFDLDNVHEFTVDKNSTNTFTVDIPIPQTDNKVFISVYLDAPEGDEDSGRSLYINSDYIHDSRDVNGLRISTERQAYEAGETVVMNVNVSRADNLALTGPGLDYNGYIAGNTTIDFEVPNVLSGVYRYEIMYGDATGQYLLDIHGFDLIVKAAQVGPGQGGE